MKDETTNSYELTLTPNYVSDWNFNDALRELIQNGTDQEVLDPDNEFQIDYSPKERETSRWKRCGGWSRKELTTCTISSSTLTETT